MENEENRMETEIGKEFKKPVKLIEIKNTKLMIAEGIPEIYANGMTIYHTGPTEFRLNFYDSSFGDEKGNPIGTVKSIIIIHPSLIREIIKALETNLKLFEDRFGKIAKIPDSESFCKIKESEEL